MESENIKNMSLRLMSAIAGNLEYKDDLTKKKQEGDQALEALLNAVQSCQTKYGGRSELATEDDIRIQDLCERWLNVFSHGIRTAFQPTTQTSLQSIVSAGINFALNNNSIGHSLWSYTVLHLTNHEQQRFKYLRHVNTPIGYFKAFLRSAMNERSLERYLHSWINHASVKDHYEDWALMRNNEATNILPNMASGLLSILFALSIDKSELNEAQPSENHLPNEPIIATKPPSAKATVKKNTLRQVISFDSDDVTVDKKVTKSANNKYDSEKSTKENTSVANNWNSAPPTCINSPDPGSKFISSQSEPSTSNYDTKKPQFFPDGLSEKSLESPGQILARLSEKARDIFSSKKSLTGDSNSQKDSDVSSISKHLSESESEGGPTEGSVSCLELCFPEDENDDGKGTDNYLQNVIDKQRTENLALQLKLTHLEMAHKEKCLKMERMVLDLNRENDRLKEQLKKYVSAVQMLKQDEAQSDEVKQYESKLIQVAEMHAELMEFNEVLQRRLEAANTPLVPSYSSGALSSEYSTMDNGNVQLWIPSAFLISNGSKSFHVYQVFIKIKSEEWNIYRRYSEFRKLYFDLKNTHPDIAPFKFPPKKAIGKKEAWLVERRRCRLQAFLRHVTLVLPQLRQASSRQELVTLLPFFKESDNSLVPGSSLHPFSN